MKTKIFVLTHKKYDEIDDETYIILQVSKGNSHLELNYLSDDSGDNISDQN